MMFSDVSWFVFSLPEK